MHADMVGNEIENETEAVPPQRLAQSLETVVVVSGVVVVPVVPAVVVVAVPVVDADEFCTVGNDTVPPPAG